MNRHHYKTTKQLGNKMTNPFVRKNIMSFVPDDRWTAWFFENEGPGMHTMNAAGWATYTHTIFDEQLSGDNLLSPRSIRLVVLDQHGELYDPVEQPTFWKIAPSNTPYPSDTEILTAWKTWAERQTQ